VQRGTERHFESKVVVYLTTLSIVQTSDSVDTPWCSWLRQLRYKSTVTGVFHWHNLVGRTMALRSTQPLTGIFPGG
jgi:hypothetical protein